MKLTLSRMVVKFLKITGIALAAVLTLMFLLPYLFPGFVSAKIRQWARSSIRSELNFTTARLTFFRHFPALTLTLHDLKLKGSAPFEKETLIEADEVALGVDLRSVFSEVRIDKIFLTNAYINIQVDTAGRANYNIYASKKDSGPSPAGDSTSASLKIRKILIENSRLVYNDRSLPILINARDLNYEGGGDLSKAIFDLDSHVEIGSMDLYYNRQAYLMSKKINADLITKINTNSLALFFEKNELTINQLPVTFTGRFEFLKNGYDMDFKLKSTDSDLHDIFTAMPPGMLEWLSKTEMKGFGDIDASLTGQYIAATNTMPGLVLNMKIRNGSVWNSRALVPVKNLFLNFQSRMPGLNPDSLSATVDSIYFNIDKDYFSAVLRLKGMKEPWVSAKVRSEIDLEKWSKAFGISPFDVKGRYTLDLDAEGKYATRVVRSEGLRRTTVDTVITSIPRFTLRSSLTGGYFKYASRPEAVKDISFNLDASCADNDYKHTRLALDNVNATVLSNYIRGYLKLGNMGDFPIDAGLDVLFHLADIKKVMPLDSMDLSGDLKAKIRTKGNYLPAKKMFPVTVADLQLENGRVQTKYYPHPLEKIQVSARITNSSGSLRDLKVAFTPVSFLFEGQPFMMKADLQNFENLKYAINSRGTLDIGKIYQVFAEKGYDVKGLIEANLSLRGRQSDAMAGRYDQLFNSGTLKVKDLVVNAELFPLPFRIRTGLFRFDQDKMWFDTFNASYGRTDLVLNGWLSNVTGYLTDKHQPLRGSFDLTSDYMLVDEFMAFAGPSAGNGASAKGSAPSAVNGALPVASQPSTAAGQTGVIIVPGDLSVSFNAAVKKIQYNGLDISDFKGGLAIDSGLIRLNKTSFTLIGAPVEMDAAYKSLSPQRAQFDYHINAKEFNVQRAYREIKLFRDLATSASKAEGIISLNYALAGKLDGNMHAVYPSLKGGGVLSVSKVKVKGLKLFSAVSKETNKNVTDPDLSKVDIKSTINNNIITIERTRMKVSAFKLRMEGQASFDGKLNLRFRVGLPPFGVIGIPLKITGTQDNPKVKAGRGSKKDELEETEDKDEEGKEN
ncbi:MAG TPA: AsmA-like C-terminal region-containing protein [Puia sp.]|nr:AsmA-like C-terminal region-containing protein [Puia sp.]